MKMMMRVLLFIAVISIFFANMTVHISSATKVDVSEQCPGSGPPPYPAIDRYPDGINNIKNVGIKNIALREGLWKSELTQLINITSLGPGETTNECRRKLQEGYPGRTCNPKYFAPPRVYNATEKSLYPWFDDMDIVELQPGVVIDEWNCTRYGDKYNCFDDDDAGDKRGYALSFIPWCAAFRGSGFDNTNDDDDGSSGEGRVRKALYIHGGSWYNGSPKTNSYPAVAARIATATCIPVLAIDYSLLPQGTADVVLDEIKQALRWMATHDASGDAYETATPVEVMMMGDSSGAGSAFSTLLLQQEESETWGESLPPLVSAALISPWLNLYCNSPTYVSNAFCKHQVTKSDQQQVGEACVVDAKLPKIDVLAGDLCFQDPAGVAANDYAVNSLEYLGNDIALLDDPVLNPFAWTQSFVGIPSVQFHVALQEDLFSDSTILCDRMLKDGVNCEVHAYDGMWHDFTSFFTGCLEPGATIDERERKDLLFAESVFTLIGRFARQGITRPGVTVHFEYPHGVDTAMVGEQ